MVEELFLGDLLRAWVEGHIVQSSKVELIFHALTQQLGTALRKADNPYSAVKESLFSYN